MTQPSVRRPDGARPPLPVAPGAGARVFRTARRVRLGDVRPGDGARLDALARYLQDVAADDIGETEVAGDHRWVVRRTRLEVRRRPRYEETVDLVTWCSGIGAAWAERRTSIVGSAGVAVEAVSLWVSLDPVTMRPAPLGERFGLIYGPAAAGRSVAARLLHGPAPAGIPWRVWPLRVGDFDVLGHVNNTAGWAILEDELACDAPGARVGTAEVEYRRAIGDGAEPGPLGQVRVCSARWGDIMRVWVSDDAGEVALSAVASIVALGG